MYACAFHRTNPFMLLCHTQTRGKKCITASVWVSNKFRYMLTYLYTCTIISGYTYTVTGLETSNQ